jgi:hypothetical protein
MKAKTGETMTAYIILVGKRLGILSARGQRGKKKGYDKTDRRVIRVEYGNSWNLLRILCNG